MSDVEAVGLPEGSFLAAYRDAGAHTDCYTTTVPGTHSFEHYVEAFYTTWLFKIERFILRWAVRKPSSDDQAGRLARGAVAQFAAWTVENRGNDQLLMCDFMRRTRSWLMVVQDPGTNTTRLFFGSAVVPVGANRQGRKNLGLAFNALLGFHHVYSVMLLKAAASRLARR